MDNEDLNLRIKALEAKYSRIEKRLHSTQTALNLNTRADKQTTEALHLIRQTQSHLQQAEVHRFEAIKNLNHAQGQKAEEKAKRLGRSNLALFGIVGIMIIFYIKGELEAGHLVDVLMALGASGAWGLYSAAKN